MRMQRNFLRGITQSEARGHAPGPLGSERQRREQRYEELHGISLRDWERWNRLYIREINRRTWKSGPPMTGIKEARDPRIWPEDLAAIRYDYEHGVRDPAYPGITDWHQWVEIRLDERLGAVLSYQEDHNPDPGRMQYGSRSGYWTSDMNFLAVYSAPAIELWWYH
jgi:hypothetical protein